mmetsp:Transcript_29556/g.51883  ORF Transcript_29556/g.51883 Transcript_29556/m.51883 type:complete len:483 (+) Transcript_29556:100-1548(+)
MSMRASSLTRIWRLGREVSEMDTAPTPPATINNETFNDSSTILNSGSDQSTSTLLITVMMHVPMGRRRPRRSEEEAAKIGTSWTYGIEQPDEVAVERLPTWEKESSELKQGSMPPVEACGICLDAFRHGDVLTALPCSSGKGCPSVWHADCIRKWLRAEQSTGCPLCRSDVDPGAEGGDEEGGDQEQQDSAPPSSIALEVRAALPRSGAGNAARRMTQELIQDIPFFALFLVGDSSQDEQVSRLSTNPMLAAINSLSMPSPPTSAVRSDEPAERLNAGRILPPINPLSMPSPSPRVEMWDQQPWQSMVASERTLQPTQLGEQSGTGGSLGDGNNHRHGLPPGLASHRQGTRFGSLARGSSLPRLGTGPRVESTPLGVLGEQCGLPRFFSRVRGPQTLSTAGFDRGAQGAQHHGSHRMERPMPVQSVEEFLASQATVPMDREVPNVPSGSGHGRPSSSWRSMFSGESSPITRIRNSLSRGPRR